LQDTLAEMLLSGEVSVGETVHVRVEGDHLVLNDTPALVTD